MPPGYATIDPDGWDYISHDARGGSYGVQVGSDSVTLGFFGTANDAKRALAVYKTMGDAMNVPSSDVLSRQGNVTLSWDATPSSQERSVVEDCLK